MRRGWRGDRNLTILGKECVENCRGTQGWKSGDLGSNLNSAVNILCDSLSGPQFTYFYSEEVGLFQLRRTSSRWPEACTARLGLGEPLGQGQGQTLGRARQLRPEVQEGHWAWDLASVPSSVLLTDLAGCQVLSFHLLPTGPPPSMPLHLSFAPFHQPGHESPCLPLPPTHLPYNC